MVDYTQFDGASRSGIAPQYIDADKGTTEKPQQPRRPITQGIGAGPATSSTPASSQPTTTQPPSTAPAQNAPSGDAAAGADAKKVTFNVEKFRADLEKRFNDLRAADKALSGELAKAKADLKKFEGMLSDLESWPDTTSKKYQVVKSELTTRIAREKAKIADLSNLSPSSKSGLVQRVREIKSEIAEEISRNGGDIELSGGGTVEAYISEARQQAQGAIDRILHPTAKPASAPPEKRSPLEQRLDEANEKFKGAIGNFVRVREAHGKGLATDRELQAASNAVDAARKAVTTAASAIPYRSSLDGIDGKKSYGYESDFGTSAVSAPRYGGAPSAYAEYSKAIAEINSGAHSLPARHVGAPDSDEVFQTKAVNYLIEAHRSVAYSKGRVAFWTKQVSENPNNAEHKEHLAEAEKGLSDDHLMLREASDEVKHDARGFVATRFLSADRYEKTNQALNIALGKIRPELDELASGKAFARAWAETSNLERLDGQVSQAKQNFENAQARLAAMRKAHEKGFASQDELRGSIKAVENAATAYIKAAREAVTERAKDPGIADDPKKLRKLVIAARVYDIALQNLKLTPKTPASTDVAVQAVKDARTALGQADQALADIRGAHTPEQAVEARERHRKAVSALEVAARNAVLEAINLIRHPGLDNEGVARAANLLAEAEGQLHKAQTWIASLSSVAPGNRSTVAASDAGPASDTAAASGAGAAPGAAAARSPQASPTGATNVGSTQTVPNATNGARVAAAAQAGARQAGARQAGPAAPSSTTQPPVSANGASASVAARQNGPAAAGGKPPADPLAEPGPVLSQAPIEPVKVDLNKYKPAAVPRTTGDSINKISGNKVTTLRPNEQLTLPVLGGHVYFLLTDPNNPNHTKVIDANKWDGQPDRHDFRAQVADFKNGVKITAIIPGAQFGDVIRPTEKAGKLGLQVMERALEKQGIPVNTQTLLLFQGEKVALTGDGQVLKVSGTGKGKTAIALTPPSSNPAVAAGSSSPSGAAKAGATPNNQGVRTASPALGQSEAAYGADDGSISSTEKTVPPNQTVVLGKNDSVAIRIEANSAIAVTVDKKTGETTVTLATDPESIGSLDTPKHFYVKKRHPNHPKWKPYEESGLRDEYYHGPKAKDTAKMLETRIGGNGQIIATFPGTIVRVNGKGDVSVDDIFERNLVELEPGQQITAAELGASTGEIGTPYNDKYLYAIVHGRKTAIYVLPTQLPTSMEDPSMKEIEKGVRDFVRKVGKDKGVKYSLLYSQGSPAEKAVNYVRAVFRVNGVEDVQETEFQWRGESEMERKEGEIKRIGGTQNLRVNHGGFEILSKTGFGRGG